MRVKGGSRGAVLTDDLARRVAPLIARPAAALPGIRIERVADAAGGLAAA